MLIGSVNNNPALRLQTQSSQPNASLSAQFASSQGSANQLSNTDSTLQSSARTTQASGNLSVEQAARNLDSLSAELERVTTARDAARLELQSQQQNLDASNANKRDAQQAFIAASEEYQQLATQLLGSDKTEADLTAQELALLTSAKVTVATAQQTYNSATGNYDVVKSSFDAATASSESLDTELADVNQRLQTGLDELTLSVLNTVMQQIIMDTLVAGFNNNNQIADSLRYQDYG